MDKKGLEKITDIFIRGKGIKYLFLYDKTSDKFFKDIRFLLSIFKLNLENEPMEDKNNQINKNILEEELNKIEVVPLKNEKEKEQKRNEYLDRQFVIYNELKKKSKNLFNILNIKLAKRLIYDLLFLECIKLPEGENIVDDIIACVFTNR